MVTTKAAEAVVAQIVEKARGRWDGSLYLSAADTAKLVRIALKREFPGVKFSVRSDTYAGGASIRIHWTDGPTKPEVEKITRAYAGADFDGSIDLKCYTEHWLLPDGTVTVAHAQGTENSRGCIPEVVGDAPDGTAQLVSLGADFVFADRKISPEFEDAVLSLFEEKLGRALPRKRDEQWNLLVPLAVDRLDGMLYRMVDAETESLSTVLHQYTYTRTAEEVLS